MIPKILTSTISNVQWDKSNLWDVSFVDEAPKPPFDKWLPVIDIEFAHRGVNNVSVGSTNLEIPGNIQYPNLNISFVDDENNTFMSWLLKWQRKIASYDGIHVKAYKDICRTIFIKKLDSELKIVNTIYAHVYPTGQINYQGSSDGTASVYSLSFVVMGHKIIPEDSIDPFVGVGSGIGGGGGGSW